MPVYRAVVRDKSGDIVPLATVEVFDSGTAVQSSIYEDEALATAKDNPFTSESDGTVEFYAAHGQYDIYVTRVGIDDLVYTDVDLFDSETTAQGAAGGDLDGEYPDPDVVAIQGNAVESGVPADDDILQWSTANGQWEHVAASGLAGSAGGDLSGTYPDPTVVAIQGNPVDAAAPNDGDALIWSSAGGDWVPTAATPTSGSAGGDLSGTFPNPDVVGLQGVAVAAAVGSPTSGDLLRYDGVDWDAYPDSNFIDTSTATQTIETTSSTAIFNISNDGTVIADYRMVNTTSGNEIRLRRNATDQFTLIDYDGTGNNIFTADKNGMTMSVPLVLDDDPSVALGAATKQYVDSVAGGAGSLTLATGDEILWGGASVPSGFAIQSGSSFNDRTPLIVTTAGATKSTGGNWTHSNGLTVTVNGHTLTASEIPSHTHSLSSGSVTVFATQQAGTTGGGIAPMRLDATTGPDNRTYSLSGTSGSAGSGNSHSHTGSASSDGTWRPSYRTFAVIRKT